MWTRALSPIPHFRHNTGGRVELVIWTYWTQIFGTNPFVFLVSSEVSTSTGTIITQALGIILLDYCFLSPSLPKSTPSYTFHTFLKVIFFLKLILKQCCSLIESLHGHFAAFREHLKTPLLALKSSLHEKALAQPHASMTCICHFSKNRFL